MQISFAASPSHVLVAGATGFIGKTLVDALLADGHRVTVLTRRPAAAAKQFQGRVNCFGSPDAVPSAPPVDVVINLAGARILGWRWTARRKALLMRSRVALTDELVAWMGRLQVKPRLLVSASAIGYYGVQPQGEDAPLPETAPPQPVFMSDLCRLWEEAAAAAAGHGVAVACIRLGVVLGQGGSLPMMLLPFRLGVGGRIGTGRQWMSWIHIEDVVRGIAWLMNRAPAEGADTQAALTAWNFTAPQQLQQQEFAATAGKVLHRPSIVPAPGWPMRLMLGEQSDLLLEGQRVHPARLLDAGFVFKHPTLQGALEDLCQ